MGLTHVCGSVDRRVCGSYAGDLLSWVMSHAEYGHMWITIMSNLNVIAVATLADVSCVIFAEGVTPDDELIQVARAKGVNLLSSPDSSYDVAVKISGILQ